METSQQHICKNCANNFGGKFCNRCGEKVYNEHDKSLGHLLEETFHFFTHFDGALFGTVKTMITKPGKYALDFCNGIRKKYYKPIPLFLLLVILYLLFPKFQGLNMKANTYVDDQYDYGWFSVPIVKKKMEKKGVKYEAVAQVYDSKSPKIAKLCLLLLIPLSAIVTSLLFFKSGRIYFDHFILSAEINSFFILFQFLFLPLLATLTTLISPQLTPVFYDGSWVWILVEILFGLFIIVAFRRFFGQNWFWSVFKAIVFFLVFQEGIKYLFAMIVFYVTMLFV